MSLVSLRKIGVGDDEHATLAFVREPFDSEMFGLEIGRIEAAHASSPAGYRALFESVLARARAEGYDQVLRRTRLENLAEVWALEATGFELMDVGVTFAQRVAPGTHRTREYADLGVALATDADVEWIAREMVQKPWGTRYEADPAYGPDQVRTLRARWLTNSHRGRAQAFFVGTINGEPAGYVTCLLDVDADHGELELVGTLPAFRRRRVASRLLEHALGWFAERTALVTVRTQATNISAATAYERAGFTLYSSDVTFRAALGPRQGGRA
jgi:GNAT superfamily N-acetyltransferase